VIDSGGWLLPDNIAWWGVAAVLIVALSPWRDSRTPLLGGLFLLAAVLTRQPNLWSAAPLWASAWFASERSAANPRVKRATWMAMATLPAIAATALFIWLWGGPTTPSTRDVLHGGNPAAPAAVLCLIGAMTPFFAAYLIPALRSARRSPGLVVLGGAVVGLVVGIFPHTSYDMASGRFSGFWNVVRHLPVVADRSPVVILLSTVGGAALAAWTAALPRRTGAVFLVAWLAFIAAQTANAMAYQRYYEPMVLIALPLAVAHLPRRHGGGDGDRGDAPVRHAFFACAGPLLLAAMLAAVTAFTVVRSKPDEPSDNRAALPDPLAPPPMM
jgi:hypothetical protein